MSDASVQEYILSKCKALVPWFDPKEAIHAFCGARAKSSRGDWIIEQSEADPSFIHAAGIDSPGLAGSPAIALEIVRLLKNAGLDFVKDPSFNPHRAPIITPKNGMRGLKMGALGKNDSHGAADVSDEKRMESNVVCKCEKVTEAEVVRAIRRSLPIDSTQAIRKRTRAGMGHCQGKTIYLVSWCTIFRHIMLNVFILFWMERFSLSIKLWSSYYNYIIIGSSHVGDAENYNCECRVKAIIARENNTPVEEVGGRPWPATSTLTQRWIDDDEKKQLEQRMKK